MKTNLLRVILQVRVPEDYDHNQCAKLRALPGAQPGPVDRAIEAATSSLAANLTAIDPDIELGVEVQK